MKTYLLEHNLALSLSGVDLLDGEVGIVGGLYGKTLVSRVGIGLSQDNVQCR